MSQVQHLRIGFPRALLYHKYAPIWTDFFQSLGCQIVKSPETNRQILEKGTQYSIDENCLAVKIYLGHVEYLLGKVDYIFIPRVVSLYRDERLCVKLFALADIVRNTFDNARILEYTVDKSNRQYEWLELVKMGLRVNRNPLAVVRAYRQAVQHLEHHNRTRLQKQRAMLATRSETTRVLLVAHPYITYDALLGKNVTKLLHEQGVDILYADIVDEREARKLSVNLSTDVYWTYSKELLGAIECYRDSVDGIIFLMAFPCGPDALVINLCQNTISDLSLCVLVLDELQGDAGLKTRVESFIDILRFKKEKVR